MNINKHNRNDDGYPKRLLNLHDAPRSLYVAGNLETKRPLLAVVGSRRNSNYGQAVVNDFVPRLASLGIGIVSGLALGIDSAAHKSALRSGGYTAAVIPSGLPEVYPRAHRYLSEQILEAGGALVSEHERPHEIFKHDFIARNRIIAGLADAVLVIEAGERSGTLSTVGFALDLGRTVMALPGSILSVTSKGTHNLIKQGAKLVDCVEDVVEGLGLYINKSDSPLPVSNDPDETKIIQTLGREKLERRELLHRTGLSAPVFNAKLSQLEIRGVVRALGADIFGLN